MGGGNREAKEENVYLEDRPGGWESFVCYPSP